MCICEDEGGRHEIKRDVINIVSHGQSIMTHYFVVFELPNFVVK